jgi:hypothetical protein
VVNEAVLDGALRSETSALRTRKKYSVPGVSPRKNTLWSVVSSVSMPVVEPNVDVVPNST